MSNQKPFIDLIRARAMQHRADAKLLDDVSKNLPPVPEFARYFTVEPFNGHAAPAVALLNLTTVTRAQGVELQNIFAPVPMVFTPFAPTHYLPKDYAPYGVPIVPIIFQALSNDDIAELGTAYTNYLFWYAHISERDHRMMLVSVGIEQSNAEINVRGECLGLPDGQQIQHKTDTALSWFVHWNADDPDWRTNLIESDESVWADIIE